MIVTIDYYNNEYFGESIAAEDFPRFETRAEQIIGAYTRGQYGAVLAKLTQDGYTAAANDLTTAYKNAICAQIEYFMASGILSISTGTSGDSFTVGKVSVQKGSNGATFSNRGTALICPLAMAYLEQTGLLGRAVSVPVEPFAPFPVGVV